VHTTSNKFWAKNWKDDQDAMVFVMENGKKDNVMKSDTVSGIAKDYNGNNQGSISLLDVMSLLNGKYNLITIIKIMKKDLNLEGIENKSFFLKHSKFLSPKLYKKDKKILKHCSSTAVKRSNPGTPLYNPSQA
jgi:hypothetical protein